MDHTRFITYKDKKIFYLDLSNLNPFNFSSENFIELLNRAREIVEKEKEKSVLHLTNASGAHFNKDAVSDLKDYSSSINPYIKKSAAFGVSGLQLILVSTLSNISGHNIKVFKTEEEAKEWLVE